MLIQINSDQLNVVNEMILVRGLSLTPELAIMEMIADDIFSIERTLTELKEHKANQNKLISRPKLYLVK